MTDRKKLSIKDLQREIRSFKHFFPKLKDDELFIVWALRAFITNDEHKAVDALKGSAGDKSIDAVYFDDKARIVFIIQGKYREEINKHNENRADIIQFADLALKITGDKGSFDSLKADSPPIIQDTLDEIRTKVLRRNYVLQFYYFTTGKCSKNLEKEAIKIVRSSGIDSGFEVFSGSRLMLLLSDYIDGVAPPVPAIDLEMESGNGVMLKGNLNRFDAKTEIESWVISVGGYSISKVYEQSGHRLFARNVRGFLGRTGVNRSMEETLKKQPDYFWYYNNGITIVCDNAEARSQQGREIIHIENPQIINGQQTTRTFNTIKNFSPKASVLVRVIRIPRDTGIDDDKFETLVSNIVNATNWQNAILASDLMANDRRQIELERELRKIDYFYIRKRQSKSEARRQMGANKYYSIKKEEFAQAVAASDLDPSVLRKGKELLFEEDFYNIIFPTSDPYYYLIRYWLMRLVTRRAQGYPERGYAKWLVIHFIWQHLRMIFKNKTLRDNFLSLCEWNEVELNYIFKVIDTVFHSSSKYFHSNRGKGAKALDASSFYKLKQYDSYSKFWNTRKNTIHKNAFKNKMRKFEKVLRTIE